MYSYIQKCVDPRSGLDDPIGIHPVASRYTETLPRLLA
jgi:hypothetical protein